MITANVSWNITKMYWSVGTSLSPNSVNGLAKSLPSPLKPSLKDSDQPQST